MDQISESLRIWWHSRILCFLFDQLLFGQRNFIQFANMQHLSVFSFLPNVHGSDSITRDLFTLIQT